MQLRNHILVARENPCVLEVLLPVPQDCTWRPDEICVKRMPKR